MSSDRDVVMKEIHTKEKEENIEGGLTLSSMTWYTVGPPVGDQLVVVKR